MIGHISRYSNDLYVIINLRNLACLSVYFLHDTDAQCVRHSRFSCIVCTRLFDVRNISRNVLESQVEGWIPRSHEIYFPYDTRYIIDRWNLDVSSRRGDCQKRVSDDVLNLPKFRSWRGCSDLPSKCGWITGIV